VPERRGLLEWDASAIPALPATGEPDPDPIPEPMVDAGSVGGGGVDAGKKCVGAPTACSLRTGAQCTRGCAKSGVCSGYASSCYYLSSYNCYSQRGCYWSSYDSKCQGVATGCYSLSGQATCSGQSGCSWRDTCEGTPTACSLLTAETCSQQPGCSLQ